MRPPRSTHILTLNPGERFPYILLYEDLWDDFRHKTMYDSFLYLESDSEAIDLGPIKIMDKKADYTVLPSSFSQLETNYCSLGQSVNYYSTLYKLNEKLKEKILKALNDVVYNPEIAKNLKKQKGLEYRY